MRKLIHIRVSIVKYTKRCEMQLMKRRKKKPDQRYYQMYQSTTSSTVPINEEWDKLCQIFYPVQIFDFIKHIQCLNIIGDCDHTENINRPQK